MDAIREQAALSKICGHAGHEVICAHPTILVGPLFAVTKERPQNPVILVAKWWFPNMREITWRIVTVSYTV